jgi:hypothetical protein
MFLATQRRGPRQNSVTKSDCGVTPLGIWKMLVDTPNQENMN